MLIPYRISPGGFCVRPERSLVRFEMLDLQLSRRQVECRSIVQQLRTVSGGIQTGSVELFQPYPTGCFRACLKSSSNAMEWNENENEGKGQEVLGICNRKKEGRGESRCPLLARIIWKRLSPSNRILLTLTWKTGIKRGSCFRLGVLGRNFSFEIRRVRCQGPCPLSCGEQVAGRRIYYGCETQGVHS